MDDFWKKVAVEITSHAYNYETNNREWLQPGPVTKVKEAVVRAMGRLGFFRRPLNLARIAAIPVCIGEAAAVFADDESRDLLVRLMAYQVLGPRHYRLPTNTPEYWRKRKDTPGGRQRKDGMYEFEFHNVRYIGDLPTFFNTFILEQYHCARANIGVRPGDVAIDGGAHSGDTALYFVHCGAAKVYAYECDKEILPWFETNRQPHCDRVTLVQKALWWRAGDTLSFCPSGVASRLQENGSVTVVTDTIDALVQREGLKRVDFIKMDIEGAELDALKGAEQTLREFRPRLAICVYHSLDDYAAIPAWIHSLGLGYRQYLDHFSLRDEETVLFAEVRP